MNVTDGVEIQFNHVPMVREKTRDHVFGVTIYTHDVSC